jgi:hypothetical protein
VPERNFLISPLEAGWEQTHEVLSNECLTGNLQRALEPLRIQREQEDEEWEGAGGVSGDLPENEE